MIEANISRTPANLGPQRTQLAGVMATSRHALETIQALRADVFKKLSSGA